MKKSLDQHALLGDQGAIDDAPEVERKATVKTVDAGSKLARKATLKKDKNLDVKASNETSAGNKEDFVVAPTLTPKSATVVKQESGCCQIF